MSHNDQLKQPLIDRVRGAAKGIYYKGIAATGSDFILIAPTIEVLREKWSELSEQPLNESKCAEVGLFSTHNIKDLPLETTQPLNPLGK